MRELTSVETNEVNGGVFFAIARYVAGRVLGGRAVLTVSLLADAQDAH